MQGSSHHLARSSTALSSRPSRPNLWENELTWFKCAVNFLGVKKRLRVRLCELFVSEGPHCVELKVRTGNRAVYLIWRAKRFCIDFCECDLWETLVDGLVACSSTEESMNRFKVVENCSKTCCVLQVGCALFDAQKYEYEEIWPPLLRRCGDFVTRKDIFWQSPFLCGAQVVPCAQPHLETFRVCEKKQIGSQFNLIWSTRPISLEISFNQNRTSGALDKSRWHFVLFLCHDICEDKNARFCTFVCCQVVVVFPAIEIHGPISITVLVRPVCAPRFQIEFCGTEKARHTNKAKPLREREKKPNFMKKQTIDCSALSAKVMSWHTYLACLLWVPNLEDFCVLVISIAGFNNASDSTRGRVKKLRCSGFLTETHKGAMFCEVLVRGLNCLTDSGGCRRSKMDTIFLQETRQSPWCPRGNILVLHWFQFPTWPDNELCAGRRVCLVLVLQFTYDVRVSSGFGFTVHALSANSDRKSTPLCLSRRCSLIDAQWLVGFRNYSHSNTDRSPCQGPFQRNVIDWMCQGFLLPPWTKKHSRRSWFRSGFATEWFVWNCKYSNTNRLLMDKRGAARLRISTNHSMGQESRNLLTVREMGVHRWCIWLGGLPL